MAVFHVNLFLFGFTSMYFFTFSLSFANASQITVGLETLNSGSYFSLYEVEIRTTHRITAVLEELTRIIKSGS